MITSIMMLICDSFDFLSQFCIVITCYHSICSSNQIKQQGPCSGEGLQWPGRRRQGQGKERLKRPRRMTCGDFLAQDLKVAGPTRLNTQSWSMFESGESGVFRCFCCAKDDMTNLLFCPRPPHQDFETHGPQVSLRRRWLPEFSLLQGLQFVCPGTNTFDRWEMRIHKRLIDLHSPSDAGDFLWQNPLDNLFAQSSRWSSRSPPFPLSRESKLQGCQAKPQMWQLWHLTPSLRKWLLLICEGSPQFRRVKKEDITWYNI